MKFISDCLMAYTPVSHPARGAWIEIWATADTRRDVESHPARGAWIEINTASYVTATQDVAPRKGCVD